MFGYELELQDDGSIALMQDGEVMWTSDNDDDFAEDFDEVSEPDDMDDVVFWLREHGESPPRGDVLVRVDDGAEEWINDGSDEDE